MITGVADVYYAVQDKKRAVVFNRNVLNLAVTEESDHWSAMNVGGLRVELDSTDGKPPPERAILILKTTDIRADVKTLRDKGVNFVGRSAIILGGVS